MLIIDVTTKYIRDTMKRSNTKEFIAKSVSVHGERYSYENCNYISAREPVTITCNSHGDFTTTPNRHLNGNGCAKCFHEKRSSGAWKDTKEDFVARAVVVHGNKYDYSMVDYRGSFSEVSVVCPEHGIFKTKPNNHLQGRGCPPCGRKSASIKRSATFSHFLSSAKKIHGERYEYSESSFKKMSGTTTITCQEHGEFYQNAHDHVAGAGCPSCAEEKVKLFNESRSMDSCHFIEKAQNTHGSRYGYDLVDYKRNSEPVKIICPEHGEFKQRPDSHYAGSGCPKCSSGNRVSKEEGEVFAIFSSLASDAEQSNRKLIAPYELDMVSCKHGIAIEINGVIWHSDKFKDKHYHRQKFLMCAEKGIRLISITDIEWQNRKEQITSIIRSALGARDGAPVNARQCVVEEITPAESKEFLDKWHVQGNTTAKKIAIGLRTKDGELVAVMTFSRGANYRGNAKLAADELPWSLSRYATSCTVRGGAGKLFKYAVREYGMKVVESFSMNNFFGGAMYSALGFEKVHDVPVDYQVYHHKCGLRPKSHWQRRLITQRLIECGMESLEFNPDKSIDGRTEFEIEDLCGAKRIWDTGKILWRWVAE